MSLPREATAFPSCCVTQLWLAVAGELIHECLGVYTRFQIPDYSIISSDELFNTVQAERTSEGDVCPVILGSTEE